MFNMQHLVPVPIYFNNYSPKMLGGGVKHRIFKDYGLRILITQERMEKCSAYCLLYRQLWQ